MAFRVSSAPGEPSCQTFGYRSCPKLRVACHRSSGMSLSVCPTLNRLTRQTPIARSARPLSYSPLLVPGPGVWLGQQLFAEQFRHTQGLRANFSWVRFSRLQTFRYVQAIKFVRLPGCSHRYGYAVGRLRLLRPGRTCFVASARTGYPIYPRVNNSTFLIN
jgi:hypothetical protein